jgi:DNA-binding transcriptional MerR regulator
MIKKIMIPVAAFAVTATAVSAFNGDVLRQLDTDLTETQISTLEKVSALRQNGASRDEIKNALSEAGIDHDTMKEIRTAMHDQREKMHDAIESALETKDYEAFMLAVVGSPLAEIITSKEAFDKITEAHALKESGDHEAARAIMDELGMKRGMMMGNKDGMHGFGGAQSHMRDMKHHDEREMGNRQN